MNTQKQMPKSYLAEAEREAMRVGGTDNAVLILEAQAARRAGDLDTALEWFAIAELPTSVLKSFKRWYGSDFIREKGFNTSEADKELGKNWLNE